MGIMMETFSIFRTSNFWWKFLMLNIFPPPLVPEKHLSFLLLELKCQKCCHPFSYLFGFFLKFLRIFVFVVFFFPAKIPAKISFWWKTYSSIFFYKPTRFSRDYHIKLTKNWELEQRNFHELWLWHLSTVEIPVLIPIKLIVKHPCF